MVIIAKIALGMASTVALATVYTFREGIIRVDVDEFRDGGSHVHFWVPAAAVPGTPPARRPWHSGWRREPDERRPPEGSGTNSTYT